MKIHYLQHVPFEGLGSIEDWIRKRGHSCTRTRLYEDEILPNVTQIDWLIIMGGPMNVYESDRYSWLTQEMAYIKAAIDRNIPVLGVCLGAQLIAAALGARVTKNPEPEIGWFPVTRAAELTGNPLAYIFPAAIDVFHWHGDTFELPEGSIRIAGSAACRNQGFIYRVHVIGLQFHLESTETGIRNLIEHCRDEITNAPYIQSPGDMLSDEVKFSRINDVMAGLLDYLASLTLKPE